MSTTTPDEPRRPRVRITLNVGEYVLAMRDVLAMRRRPILDDPAEEEGDRA